jgi:hypothetical protein
MLKIVHQLTPNAIVKLGVFIWVIRSQGVRTEANAFCRVHELHYQTKARPSDKLHNNFGYYNFVYRRDYVAPMLAYQTKWHSYWFYAEVDSEQREDFEHMLMSPLKISFDLKRPNCRMSRATQDSYKAYNIVVKRIGT